MPWLTSHNSAWGEAPCIFVVYNLAHFRKFMSLSIPLNAYFCIIALCLTTSRFKSASAHIASPQAASFMMLLEHLESLSPWKHSFKDQLISPLANHLDYFLMLRHAKLPCSWHDQFTNSRHALPCTNWFYPLLTIWTILWCYCFS